MTQLSIELNIALIPTAETAEELYAISKKLVSRHTAIVTLDEIGTRLGLSPHLTLYQVPLPLATLPTAGDMLEKIAHRTKLSSLRAVRYAYNADEASFEVQRESTPRLTALQEEVIATLNPLRGNQLLERDPSGAKLIDTINTVGVAGENIRTYGYGEVGKLFRPHDTTNWFTLGTEIDSEAESLPEPSSLSGVYRAIGIYTLGPHGTCPQLIVEYPLANI